MIDDDDELLDRAGVKFVIVYMIHEASMMNEWTSYCLHHTIVMYSIVPQIVSKNISLHRKGQSNEKQMNCLHFERDKCCACK